MSGRVDVLLVDDDRDEVDVALRALQRSGVDASVAVARDGQEALEALGLEGDGEVRAPWPAVVLLDLKMPRVDGLEVLRRIRAADAIADVPVVVLSSSDREADVERCYALGANSFVVKRHDARSPGAYIAEAVRYWLSLNQPPPARAREGRGREPRWRD